MQYYFNDLPYGSGLYPIDFATYEPSEFRRYKRLVTQYNKRLNRQYKPIYKAEGVNKGYSGLKLNNYVRNQMKNGDPMALEVYEEVKNLPPSKANEIIRMRAQEIITNDGQDSFNTARTKAFLSRQWR